MNLHDARFVVSEGPFAGPFDLAHVDDFLLGDIRVIPAERRVVAPDGREGNLEPLVMRVLVALARMPGRTMSRDDLVTECWDRRIVGDDPVNRVMSRLRKRLAEVADDRVRVETIPKVGYRLTIEEAPFEPATAPAAATGETAEPVRPSRWQGRRLVLAGASAAMVALVAAVALVPAPDDGVALAIDTVPAGVEADRSRRFAGDLTSEVAGLVGPMTRLTVIDPATSTEADMVMRVSLDPPGPDGAHRAHARLVDQANGAVVWSRTFEGGSEPLVRERAAYTIAGVIRCGLDRSSGNLDDPVSRRLYFSACDAVDEGDWPRAHSFARQITERRPDRAASWACLALTEVHLGRTSPDRRAALVRSADAHARRALAMDPRSGLAHSALAAALDLQGKPSSAVLEEGIRVDPEQSGLLMRYSRNLRIWGYTGESIATAERAMALEPNNWGAVENAVVALMAAGRHRDARRLAERYQRLWPRFYRGSPLDRELLFYDANPREALARLDRVAGDDAEGVAIERLQLAWRANPRGFDWQAFDRTATRMAASRSGEEWVLAFVAARLGDTARALHWLGRAPADPRHRQYALLFRRDAAELRRDPRFFAKMAEIGLADIWRERGAWPDFCAEPGLRYDCKAEAARIAARKRV